MKTESFIKLINEGEYYALYKIPSKDVKLLKGRLNYNEESTKYFDREIIYGVCTNLYECEDGIVAVSGVAYITKDTYALPKDIGIKCKAILCEFPITMEEEMRDDEINRIERWLPNGTKAEEVKFGDQAAFDKAMSDKVSIPEGHRREEPVHPDYYKGDNKDGKSIEVFDIIDQFVSGDFYLGNVLKYVCRAGKKSKETKKRDLEKAAHYIMEAIKRI